MGAIAGMAHFYMRPRKMPERNPLERATPAIAPPAKAAIIRYNSGPF